MLDGYLTTEQAAARLKVTMPRIRQLCLKGRLPHAVKVGRDWLIPVAGLETFLATDRDRRYKDNVPRPKDDG